jgi:site-specific recombinase XerD
MNPVLQSLEFPSGAILGEARPWFVALLASRYQPSTVRLYWRALAVFSSCLLGNGLKTARDVTRDDLVAYDAELIRRKLAPATRENYLQTPKSYFDWLEKAGTIFDNPARGFAVPRKKPRLQRIPTEKEVARVIDSIDGQKPYDQLDRAVLEVTYGAGLRIHELAGLTIDAVDIGGCTVRIMGKGAKERVVPITRMAAQAIRTYLQDGRRCLLGDRKDDTALWIGRSGRPLKLEALRLRICNRARRVGICISPHDLRRAFATHLLVRGVSPAILKELLGHATYTHLNEYLRYVPSELMEIHGRSHPGK